MAVLFALAAAMCNAVATILERLGVESAPSDATFRWRLVAHVLRRPIWLLGLLAMVGAFLFQAVALSQGGLSLVQPLLVSELLFLVLILRIWFGRPLGWRECVGTLCTVAGLAIFLAVSDQGGGRVVPSRIEWVCVVVACLGAVAIAILLAQHGSRAWRAAWLGLGGGVGFALTAACMKATTTLFDHGGFVAVFEHFEPYGIAVFGAGSLYLVQNAYHAGPVTASQATLLIADPITSIVIGVGVFGDNLRGSYGALSVDALALLVMAFGLFLLCHSPLIVNSTTEERLSSPGTPVPFASEGPATPK